VVTTGESIAATTTPAAAADRYLVRIQWAVVSTIAALIMLTSVRLWFVEGLLRRVTIDGPSMAPILCGRHHLVICDDCGFSFRCDAEHVPDDDRVTCPNCGHTDNRLTNARLEPPDRVLIDRWRLVGQRPQLGEIVALQAPESNTELAVKRVAAVSPTELAIREGDLYLDDSLIRKSPAELRQVRLLVHDNGFQPQTTENLPHRWRGTSNASHWQASGTGFRLASLPSGGDRLDWLEYHHWACTANPRLRGVATCIRDNDPYNQGETRRGLNSVSDVLLSCRVRAEGRGQLAFVAVDGNRRFEVFIEPQKRIILKADDRVVLDQPLKLDLSRGKSEIEFGLCDRQVLFCTAGRTIIRWPYERSTGPQAEVLHPLAIGASSLDIELSHLCVWRDIYYLDPRGRSERWQGGPLPGAHLAVLGDNQPVSIDSRQWPAAAVSDSAIVGCVYRPFWAGAR